MCFPCWEQLSWNACRWNWGGSGFGKWGEKGMNFWMHVKIKATVIQTYIFQINLCFSKCPIILLYSFGVFLALWNMHDPSNRFVFKNSFYHEPRGGHIRLDSVCVSSAGSQTSRRDSLWEVDWEWIGRQAWVWAGMLLVPEVHILWVVRWTQELLLIIMQTHQWNQKTYIRVASNRAPRVGNLLCLVIILDISFHRMS